MAKSNKDIKLSEFVRRGGNATKKKYGRAHFSAMGKKGYKGKLKKYGKDYFRRLSMAGIEARRRKSKERKSGVNQLVNVLTGQI